MHTNKSLPIYEKYDLQQIELGRMSTRNGAHSSRSVGRQDFTKRNLSRSLSNPCAYDHNMRSSGAPSNVRNQLTFMGGVTSFIGEPVNPWPHQAPSSGRPGTSGNYVGGLFHNRPATSAEQRRPSTADHGKNFERQFFRLGSMEQADSRGKTGKNSGTSRMSSRAEYNDKISWSRNSGSRPLNETRKQCQPASRMSKHVNVLNDPLLKKANADSSSKLDNNEIEEILSQHLTNVLLENLPQEQMNGLDSSRFEIKDLVKDAVKEYFDSMNLPDLLESQRAAEAPEQGQEMFTGYNENGEEIWAVVKKDQFASRPPSSRMQRSKTPNNFTRTKEQFWNNDNEFQSNLQTWASTAPDHEKEIVKNLLKKLNGGQTPADLKNTSLDRPRFRRAGLNRSESKFEPYQFQCDSSMFTKPPYNPQRHFTINPEWTSEKLTVKRIPAAHLHPSATFKNKLGLLTN